MVEVVIAAAVTLALVSAGLVAWRLVRGPAGHPYRFLLRVGILTLACSALVTWSAWKLSNARTVQLFGGIVPRVDTREAVVALTFDDGPSADYTEEVLSILRGHKVRATFFLIGGMMARNPDETRRIVAEGHEVGNHSFSHPRMIAKSYAFVQQQIEETDRLIRAAGYAEEIQFRSPYGKKLVVLPYYLWRTGRQNIFWDVAPEAYLEVATDPEKMVEHVLTEARPGSIILMHVMGRKRAASRQALPGIIQGLRERGYRFVTVSELLAMP